MVQKLLVKNRNYECWVQSQKYLRERVFIGNFLKMYAVPMKVLRILFLPTFKMSE
jgi:hypothetical protein